MFHIEYSDEMGNTGHQEFADESDAIEAYESLVRIIDPGYSFAGFPQSVGWEFQGWYDEDVAQFGYTHTKYSREYGIRVAHISYTRSVGNCAGYGHIPEPGTTSCVVCGNRVLIVTGESLWD